MSELLAPAALPRRWIHPALAWGLVLMIYVIFYGWSAWGSVSALLHGRPVPTGSSDELATQWRVLVIIWHLLLVPISLAIWALLDRRRRRLLEEGLSARDLTMPSVRQLPIVTLVVVAIIQLAFLVGVLLATAGLGEYQSRPDVSSSLQLGVADLLYSITVGPLEEIGVLAAPVLLLRAAGQRWRVIYGVCILERLSFHADYGLALLAGLTLWAAAMIALYRLTGHLAGIMLGHGLYNGLGNLGDLLRAHLDAGDAPGEAVLIIRLSLAVAGMILLVMFGWRGVQKHRAEKRGAATLDGS